MFKYKSTSIPSSAERCSLLSLGLYTSCRIRGRRVTMPGPRGRKERPTRLSITELLPELCGTKNYLSVLDIGVMRLQNVSLHAKSCKSALSPNEFSLNINCSKSNNIFILILSSFLRLWLLEYS